MAEPPHRKVEKRKVQFSDAIETLHIKDIYPGERFVANLKSTLQNAKAQSREDWLNGDGAATSYASTRPSRSLVHIEETQRSHVEREEWSKVLERSSKAARIRAVQMHLHVHSNLNYSLPITTAPQASQPAKQISANLVAFSTVEYGRNWCYDTGCHATCIGKKHLSPAELQRVFQVEAKGLVTAAGTTWTTSAVYCYVPYLGGRRCYVLDDCPPALSVNEELDDYGAVFIWTK